MTTNAQPTRRVLMEGDLYRPRTPDGAVDITRRGPWSNPFGLCRGHQQARDMFRAWLVTQPALIARARRELTGRALACFCLPHQTCHGDVWIEILDHTPPGVRALTIRQPWASAIAELGKDIENRTWGTAWRGLLLLHTSARKPSASAVHDVAALAGRAPTSNPRGTVIATAQLAGICPPDHCTCHSPWAETGRHHWQLRDVQRLPEPITCRGALGLWVPDWLKPEPSKESEDSTSAEGATS